VKNPQKNEKKAASSTCKKGAYNISVNVDEEIGGEVKGCRLPGGGYCIQFGIRYDKQLGVDKTLKIYLVPGHRTRGTSKGHLPGIHR
jgi:hypothetical protein